MIHLTRHERDFIERGGTIWCMRELTAGAWYAIKLDWESAETMRNPCRSPEQALQLIHLLVDLAGPSNHVLHHEINSSSCPQRLRTAGEAGTGKQM